MKTQDFLNQVNARIAEVFTPFIGKPDQKFGDVHGIVDKAIADLLPGSGLMYTTWNLIPDYAKYGFIAHDKHVFTLETPGFKKYANRWSVGKWIAPPYYTYAGEEKAETVEELVVIALQLAYQERISNQRDRIQDLHQQIAAAEQAIKELTNEMQQL